MTFSRGIIIKRVIQELSYNVVSFGFLKKLGTEFEYLFVVTVFHFFSKWKHLIRMVVFCIILFHTGFSTCYVLCLYIDISTYLSICWIPVFNCNLQILSGFRCPFFYSNFIPVLALDCSNLFPPSR